MKGILTGSDGFIGSHFAENFCSEEWLFLDRKTGFDLKDVEKVKALPDVDVVVHLAAFNGTKHFYNKPFDVMLDNTLPTLNLLKRYRGTKTRFIFASTCEIFNGAIDRFGWDIPTSEDVPAVFVDTTNPRWSYSIPKLLGENAVANSGLSFAIVRFFNIYGPRQEDHFIDEFCRRVIDDNDTTLHGDDSRSFCYVLDAVKMLNKVVNSDEELIVNIGRNSEVKISVVASLILELLGLDPKALVVKNSPEGSVSRRCPDVATYEKLFGPVEYTELKDGLINCLRRYL